MHILIVDDDPLFRSPVERVLHREGHTTCSAGRGSDALRLLYTEPVQAIILDINLTHEMSGWDLIRIKFADSKLRTIPLVIMSGYAQEDLEQGVQELAKKNILSGKSTILSKPFHIQDLLKFLNEVKEEGDKKKDKDPDDGSGGDGGDGGVEGNALNA